MSYLKGEKRGWTEKGLTKGAPRGTNEVEMGYRGSRVVMEVDLN